MIQRRGVKIRCIGIESIRILWIQGNIDCLDALISTFWNVIWNVTLGGNAPPHAVPQVLPRVVSSQIYVHTGCRSISHNN